jgi:hypothetical protein
MPSAQSAKFDDIDDVNTDVAFQHYRSGAKRGGPIRGCCSFIKTFITILAFLCM